MTIPVLGVNQNNSPTQETLETSSFACCHTSLCCQSYTLTSILVTLPGASLEFDQDIIIPLPFLRKQLVTRSIENDHQRPPHDHRNPVAAGSCFVLVHGGWPPWRHGWPEGWSLMAPEKGKLREKKGAAVYIFY